MIEDPLERDRDLKTASRAAVHAVQLSTPPPPSSGSRRRRRRHRPATPLTGGCASTPGCWGRGPAASSARRPRRRRRRERRRRCYGGAVEDARPPRTR